MNTYFFKLPEVAIHLGRSNKHFCADCRKPFDFSKNVVEGYEHDGGWSYDVSDPSSKKYWFYVTCKCGYQTSFAKMGIERS